MTQYLISATATSKAIDYDYFKKLAFENNFQLFITRADSGSGQANMTFIPMHFASGIHHVEMIRKLDANSPLLITYEIQMCVS